MKKPPADWTPTSDEPDAEEPSITPAAVRQHSARRKNPIVPFVDPRPRDPLYNPVVDDYVDVNNPRWKALQYNYRRTGPFFIGKCVSTYNAKTAMIEVPYWTPSRRFGKFFAIKRSTRFMAHDEDEICEPGDTVEIRHSKTWSKRKHTVVTRILKKEPGNAFLQEHPEFAVVRSRATLRRKIEDMIEEELVAAGLTKPKGGRKEEKAQKQA
jgi:ribosomal protein S17